MGVPRSSRRPMDAQCQRLRRAVREDGPLECLDPLLILDERHLERVFRSYASTTTHIAPIRGSGNEFPERRRLRSVSRSPGARSSWMPSRPVWRGDGTGSCGLIHHYERAA